MDKLGSGTCKFEVIEDVSKKTGNKYKCIKLTFNDYELSTPLFINNDQLQLIKDHIAKK